MNTLSTINRLAALTNEPRSELHYIQERVQMPNPNAYLPIERQWQREALELEAAVEAARGNV